MPHFRARMDLRVLSDPSADAAPAPGLVVRKGQAVEYTETRFQTISPAQLTIQQDLSLKEVADYGTTRYLSRTDYYLRGKLVQLELRAGQSINVLQYRAEGDWLFEVHSRVYGGECLPCRGSRPETAWWIKIAQGGKVGWIQINEQTVEFLRRTF